MRCGGVLVLDVLEDDRLLSEDDDDEVVPLAEDAAEAADAADGVGEARRWSRLADGVLISLVDEVRRTKLNDDEADALMGVLSISSVCEDVDSKRVDTLISCCDADEAGAAGAVGLLLLVVMMVDVKVGERGLSMVLVHATRGLTLGLIVASGTLLLTVTLARVAERGVRRGGTTPCWWLLLMLALAAACCCTTVRVVAVVFTSIPSTMVRVTLDGEGPGGLPPLGDVPEGADGRSLASGT